MFKIFYITFIACLASVSSVEVERVDDGDLIHLLTGGESTIVLFTKSNCAECTELETVLNNIQHELKPSIAQVIVKAQDSHLVHLYDPTREPALVYFRHGIPILYYGTPNEFEIVQFFTENKEPVVKELSDDNFEHLTQASTGATTGDWFVFFYSADCIFCQRLYAVWESVGGRLKRRMNVARVNRFDAGVSTATRFGIKSSPEFIFLRQGKVYPYTLKEYTPKAFIEFAEGGYRKQTHPDNVPPLSTSDLFESINIFWNYLDSQTVAFVVLLTFVLLVLFLLFTKIFFKKSNEKQKSTKKSK